MKIIKIVLILSMIFVFVQPSFGQDEGTHFTFNKTQQVGIRLGVWANNGAKHPALIMSTDGQSQVETSIGDANFYVEGYYAYNLFSSFYGEISFGMVNRGTVKFYYANNFDLGHLLLYPILIQGKVYPLGSTHSRFQPFLGAGGGLYYGRHSIQITTDYYAQYYGLQGDSKSDFNYTLVGGFDWLLGEKTSLELQARYMPINFSDDLIFVKDYKATTITVGFKYRFNKSNK